MPQRSPISSGTELRPLQSEGAQHSLTLGFLCKKLIFSIYCCSPGQLLLLKSTHTPPVLCSSGWFLPSSGQDLGVSHFRCWRAARHLSWRWTGASSWPLPLEGEVLLLWSMEPRPPWLFLKVLSFPFTSISVTQLPLPSHGLASPAMPAYSHPEVPP